MIIKPNLKSDIAILKSVFSLLSKDKQVRKSVVTQDILWFFRLYFPHYITYPIADFQVEILGLLQEEKNKKLFFTAISSAKIDGVKVTNPVNLKGSDAEISCFVAFQDETELSAVNQIANQMDLKINKILPTSFAVFQLITKSDKNVSDGLIIRLAEDSSEETFLTEGHINEVYNLDLGLRKIEFWKIAQEILLKEGRFSEGSPIWLYSEGEESPLEEIKEFFSEFPWREKFGFGQIPTINNLPLPHGVNQSDASLFALAREESDEANRV